jgi:arylsulfatase A-like enzyme
MTSQKYLIILIQISIVLLTLNACKEENHLKEATNRKNNILFISVDDLNDWVGYTGKYPISVTPNIDKLASQGTSFSNAHCQAPLCAPSRASLFTGLYPNTTGLYYQFTDEDLQEVIKDIQDCVLLPDYLESQGYQTIAVGKVFHNGDRASVFDKYGGIFPEMAFGPRPPERMNYDPAWFSDTRRTATDWGGMEISDTAMSDYKIADWAIDQLHQNYNDPFFLSVGFIRPHVPWHVPVSWMEKFENIEITLPAYQENDLEDVPEFSRQLHAMPAMPKTEWLIAQNQWKNMVRAYLASMAFVDHQIGRLLDSLAKSKYKDNTIIVLWSDHGYHLGEKNRTAKHSLWERATHIPLIFSGPGIGKDKICNPPVGLIDIYPTVLDLLNLSPNPQNEGNSLVPFLSNKEVSWDRPALSFYGYKNTSIYKDNYHLIQYRDGSGELYDLDNDPNEWNNLFLEKSNSSLIKNYQNLIPPSFAPMASVNRLNVNTHIDKELLEFGITDPDKKH